MAYQVAYQAAFKNALRDLRSELSKNNPNIDHIAFSKLK